MRDNIGEVCLGSTRSFNSTVTSWYQVRQQAESALAGAGTGANEEGPRTLARDLQASGTPLTALCSGRFERGRA